MAWENHGRVELFRCKHTGVDKLPRPNLVLAWLAGAHNRPYLRARRKSSVVNSTCLEMKSNYVGSVILFWPHFTTLKAVCRPGNNLTSLLGLPSSNGLRHHYTPISLLRTRLAFQAMGTGHSSSPYNSNTIILRNRGTNDAPLALFRAREPLSPLFWIGHIISLSADIAHVSFPWPVSLCTCTFKASPTGRPLYLHAFCGVDAKFFRRNLENPMGYKSRFKSVMG